MKPPPRTRNKPERSLTFEPVSESSVKQNCTWQRPEQRKLLSGLRRLSRAGGRCGDIDYDHLSKQLPSRSVAEIQAVVDCLKNKVISRASLKMKQIKWEEKRSRKPIEVWTDMASAVVGTLERPITCAFSQMLIVSSTEPCTLRYCDPPQVLRTPTDENRPVGRTIRLPVRGLCPGAKSSLPLQVPRTSATTLGLAISKIRVPNNKFSPPQQQPSPTARSPLTRPSHLPGTEASPAVPPTDQQPEPLVSEHITPSSGSVTDAKTQSCAIVFQTTQEHAATTPTVISRSLSFSSSSSPSSSGPSSATSLMPPSSTAAGPGPISCSTHPLSPLSSPAAGVGVKFGRTCKCTKQHSPRSLGVKCIVDFERIYRYLSAIHQPTDECHLTPMESAIMLDLLMSLPEELPLLDCTSLHKHLVQVYQSFSAPTDSQMAKLLFKNLKGGPCAQPEGWNVGSGTRQGDEQSSDRTDSRDVVGSTGKKLHTGEAEGKPPQSNNTSNQPGKEDMMGFCRPLNPFMVPLKLLKRRSNIS
ncbi:snRNA-activating protein complex subunit 2 [Echeneis naucrates]|uniref:snRNA-activating protein complex subunit 2 n=1 Tax=Echeneis naucrates TaxID=173247 RepID=A0A665V9S3_ECHNA|nr:snRNA-activating protein complex subunit 2 [Echeneis naucrates]